MQLDKTVSKKTAKDADDFLRPLAPTGETLDLVLNALDEKQVEVNAMLTDFYRRPVHLQITKQVDRKTFQGEQQ